MKALKKIAVSLFVTISLASASTAFAKNPTDEEVKTAIDDTVAKVEESIAAIENGADNEAVMSLINDARQMQKNISNNALDLKRNKASSKLKAARIEARNSDMKASEQQLKEALAGFQEIKEIYAKTH
ncbi:MAG: hypothetical protein M8364_11240 [Methylobacter sp.]|uniref:hypothetical protein n=1 Tax=Methylobacter sp. TaxID=2051955 RepID=UPI00258E43CE|nr:hypothetical protein [Methylobacter sp.]MCL7421466.1 hypothetical protein [Methylobacter sp.]